MLPVDKVGWGRLPDCFRKLRAVYSWRARDTIWTDGSRFDIGKVGAACAWRARENWTGRRFHLGNNRGVFNAEAFLIYQALKVFRARQKSGCKYTVFSDSQSAIRRALSDAMRPSQQWAKAIIEVASEIVARDNEIARKRG